MARDRDLGGVAVGVWIRARVMCCAEWGCMPADFELSCERGDVAVEDVIETFLYRASEPILGARLEPWLFRERAADAAAKLKEARALALRIRATTNDEKRAALVRRLEQLGSARRG